MIRDDNLMPLDVLFEEKAMVFESGEDKEHDKDLDEMIWELGDYENEEAPQDAAEFKEDAPIEEELAEKEMVRSEGGRTYLKEREYVAAGEPGKGRFLDVKPLRLEIDGNDCEIVCGWISAAKRKKLEAYCLENDLTVNDIWYDEIPMRIIMGKNWRSWYKVDGIFHETGFINGDRTPRGMRLYVDDEPVESVDPELVATHYETLPKPGSKKGCVPVTAGIFNEARYIFTLEIAGDFEPKKLAFHYSDLSKLGVPRMMLAEVRYANRVMDFSHQDYENEDFLDVVFLS